MVSMPSSNHGSRAREYALPIIGGLSITVAGIVPWTFISRMNARIRPDIPWAALVTLVYLTLLVSWLNGAGPPRKTAGQRWERLRLWPPRATDVSDASALSAGIILGLLGFLYAAWILIGRLSPLPDLAAFPTTSYRWSMFLMGGITAGVVEEAAFRGYMLTGLERSDRANSLWVMSLVFAAAHVTKGLGAVLLLGPGLFAASILYGALARRTGTILPGIAIHVLGDLAYMYLGVLRGDGRLLFTG